ncbi:hypothetical protein E4U42_000794 [Claviceps africana]|uniref:Uncharacterized protein n=1 Tax=Claviceps africana TaxID=83212 RepID=A0A8K0JB79_9HYPO|nr:hypothetical protein E4U42_000794 [Claviceps africana]
MPGMSGYTSTDEAAVTDMAQSGSAIYDMSPRASNKMRSLSDGGGTPSRLSPSPRITESSRGTWKDDIDLRDAPSPATPCRPQVKRLSLPRPSRQFTPPPTTASNPCVRPPPLSPKLDPSQIYASPTNILPRRSRGLDFSRAATSLHHSTLAESSPDSSPTIGERAMSIPRDRHGSEFGAPEQSSSSLWSIMGSHEKMNAGSSLGGTIQHAVGSDSSSSSGDDDAMDEDMEEPYITTPQVSRTTFNVAPAGPFGSPAMSSLINFQQRQRHRKPSRKKMRGPMGLGLNVSAASISKSPPSSSAKSRRESISWQANQLHISTADGDESARSQSDVDTTGGEAQRGVIRRAVTRRGNLLPKTKTFARIRAALFEEVAPAEAETRREAEVVKQVRESDVTLGRRAAPPSAPSGSGTATSALSSPNLTSDSIDDMQEYDVALMSDLSAGTPSNFKQHAIKNPKAFLDTFSESSSTTGGARTTPPPPAWPALESYSGSGVSEDATMDSPLPGGPSRTPVSQGTSSQGLSAAEMTWRFNNKRRRDDDFDPCSFKRRAVSPSMSAHNSPIPQSPMQRDSAPWGSRSGSAGAERGGSSAQSDAGSVSGGTPGAFAAGRQNGKGRVGFQGMVDTNDGIMRMSIE